jgi:hypothetical protein
MRRPSSFDAGRFEFKLVIDNNNNPEQCNVPNGLRSNDLSMSIDLPLSAIYSWMLVIEKPSQLYDDSWSRGV